MSSSPTSLQSLQDQIAQARASKSALPKSIRIRGGGTKDFYGNPLGDHTVLDTRSHSGITSYEPSELVVTVRAGTPLAELEAALADQNQYLPFEAPHFAQGGTVGGMVASGLSGAARAVTGSVRDHILGVQIINGAGEILNFGGTVMKNVAGYDVSRLLAGSMGTLALMTEVSIKVLPIPVADATLMCRLGQTDALALMHRWRAQPLPINSTAWLHDSASAATSSTSAIFHMPADYLFVRLRGAKAAVDSALGRLQQDVEAAGGAASQMDSAAAAKDWQTANNHQMPFFVQAPVATQADEMCLWRLSLPATTPALQVQHPQYIEWQGAQRWLWARASEGDALRAIASKAGGHAVLFKSSHAHGDADKASGAFQAQSAVLTKINQNLRQQLDPHGVFNTGRI
jgi:glycolate oxidase FAD binding subunit